MAILTNATVDPATGHTSAPKDSHKLGRRAFLLSVPAIGRVLALHAIPRVTSSSIVGVVVGERMVTITKETETWTAWGKKLDKAVPYSFSYDAYESFEEVEAAKDVLSNAEQVKFRNDQKASNARTKAYNKALTDAGHEKPTEENDDQLRLRTVRNSLLTAKLPDGSPKYTEEQARQVASTVTGVDWID